MSTHTGPLTHNQIPPFASLPLRPTDPPLSAWSLYGPNDELGTLNRLTDSLTKTSALSEIRTGKRISLNAPLNAQTKSGRAFFGRELFHLDLMHKSPRAINDCFWGFNSQVSSQWDGLRHFAYQKEKLFYNGVTLEDIHGSGFEERKGNAPNGSTVSRDPGTERNGIQVISEQGIVGRGILLDYHSWRLAQNPVIPFDPFETDAITLEQLKAVAKAQGTEIRFGDILVVRSGYGYELAKKNAQDLSALKDVQPPHFGGVGQSEEVLKWIWENFSAVAGDQPSFECWPTKQSYSLHEVLLAGWGMPIGELFDLEKLAEHCKQEKRWSFFLVSEVCNVTGGTASPPNCLAIF